jgi:hypothetical protein
MDKELMEKYLKEMMNTYNTVKPTMATATEIPKSEPQTAPNVGQLIAIVTAVRSLYPVVGAKVTVFTGTVDSKNIIATAYTDQSGRTEAFILPTPSKQLSLNSQNTQIPYSLYNMLVEAEGYVDTLHLNIPIFSGVTSLQRSNLILLETAGEDKSMRIFDEAQQYNL